MHLTLTIIIAYLSAVIPNFSLAMLQIIGEGFFSFTSSPAAVSSNIINQSLLLLMLIIPRTRFSFDNRSCPTTLSTSFTNPSFDAEEHIPTFSDLKYLQNYKSTLMRGSAIASSISSNTPGRAVATYIIMQYNNIQYNALYIIVYLVKYIFILNRSYVL